MKRVAALLLGTMVLAAGCTTYQYPEEETPPGEVPVAPPKEDAKKQDSPTETSNATQPEAVGEES